MGIKIDRTEFTPQDYQAFAFALEENLLALRSLSADPEFGVGPASLGAELEMYIVDHRGLPLYINEELLAEADDPELAPELNRYNLEFNLPPFALADAAFRRSEEAQRYTSLVSLPPPFIKRLGHQPKSVLLHLQEDGSLKITAVPTEGD